MPFFSQFVWLSIQVRFTHCDWLMYLIVSFNLYIPTFPTLLSLSLNLLKNPGCLSYRVSYSLDFAVCVPLSFLLCSRALCRSCKVVVRSRGLNTFKFLLFFVFCLQQNVLPSGTHTIWLYLFCDVSHC